VGHVGQARTAGAAGGGTAVRLRAQVGLRVAHRRHLAAERRAGLLDAGRLERDELVAKDGSDAEGHELYRITPRGLREVQDWWEAAVEREAPVRDELAIKLALAVGTPGVDARDVVQRQRTATLRALQAHTRRKASLVAGDTAAALVLDALVFAAEAEVRWLDHCEARLVRSRNGVSR
jgi:hypothetical protein